MERAHAAEGRADLAQLDLTAARARLEQIEEQHTRASEELSKSRAARRHGGKSSFCRSLNDLEHLP